jgi:hypothetical protein
MLKCVKVFLRLSFKEVFEFSESPGTFNPTHNPTLKLEAALGFSAVFYFITNTHTCNKILP